MKFLFFFSNLRQLEVALFWGIKLRDQASQVLLGNVCDMSPVIRQRVNQP